MARGLLVYENAANVILISGEPPKILTKGRKVMHILADVFTGITMLHKKLTYKQQYLDDTAYKLSKAYRDIPADQDPKEDTYILALHQTYRRLLDDKNRTQADYDFACDLARRLIDRIEDNTIATGLQLYGVNRLSWRATAECLGVQDIQRRCEDYLNNHEQEDFYF